MKDKGDERRRFIRVRFPCKIIIYTPQEHIISSHTEDISVGGLRLILQEELTICSLVDLEIYIKEEPIICKGRVVWVEKKESRWNKGVFYFDMGLDFCEIEEKDRQLIRKVIEEND